METFYLAGLIFITGALTYWVGFMNGQTAGLTRAMDMMEEAEASAKRPR